jgi:diguanylate cyclase (GGDEF)-like protein
MLDISTLQFASLSARLAFVLLFLIACFRGPATAAFRHWTAGMVASCAGISIIYGGWGLYESEPLLAAMAFMFLGFSIAFAAAGGARFFGHSYAIRRLLLTGLAPGAAYLGAWLASGSFHIAILPALLLLSFFSLRAMGAYVARRGEPWLPSRIIVVSSLATYAGVFGMVAVVVLVEILLTGAAQAHSDNEFATIFVIDQAIGTIFYVGLLTMSLERAQAALREMATTDPLTGLANRRSVQERTGPVFVAGRRNRRPMAVLLADLDNFKSINDRYGHEAGDAVLAEFATRFQELVRGQQDVVGRWGGEEFIAVLHDTDAGEARQLGERLCREVAGTPFGIERDEGRALVDLTVSIGVAEFEAEDGELSKVIAKADKALYAAKYGGRNRVDVYSAEVSDRTRPAPAAPGVAPRAGSLPPQSTPA